MQVSQHLYFQGKWSKELPFEMDGPNTLVLLFSLDPECAAYVARKFPHSHVLGCSSGGDIFGERHFDNSTSVTVIRFASTMLKSIHCDFAYETSREAGCKIAQSGYVTGVPGSMLVLTPGLLKINGAGFADGLSKGLQGGTKLFGGIAGDPLIKDTWTLDNSGVHDARAVGVAFYGSNLITELCTKSGASPLGIERTITKARGNVVYEVDEKPALNFYHQYMGEEINDITKTLQFPLSVSNQLEQIPGPLRTPQAVDLNERSVTFTEAIPEGTKARIMMVSRENIVIGAEMASEQIKKLTDGVPSDGPKLLLPISCIGRKYVLGQSIEDEVEVVAHQFRNDKIAIHGFYSFGEFASHSLNPNLCELHNQTLNLAMLFEKAAA